MSTHFLYLREDLEKVQSNQMKLNKVFRTILSEKSPKFNDLFRLPKIKENKEKSPDPANIKKSFFEQNVEELTQKKKKRVRIDIHEKNSERESDSCTQHMGSFNGMSQNILNSSASGNQLHSKSSTKSWFV